MICWTSKRSVLHPSDQVACNCFQYLYPMFPFYSLFSSSGAVIGVVIFLSLFLGGEPSRCINAGRDTYHLLLWHLVWLISQIYFRTCTIETLI
ncbi:hypothetical protein V8F33_011620 [Rhypophila sp. PSN 637]